METQTLLARLITLYPHATKTTLRQMVTRKRVRINGTSAKSVNHPVTAKDQVDVIDTGDVPKEAVILAEGLRLVHFDADIIVVEKPAGLLTSTDAQEKRPTAWRIVQEFFRRQNHRNRVHLVHRLDRDASGLLVFARTWEAYGALKRQFFEHTIDRQYDVIVHGVPRKPADRLEHLLMEDPRNGIVHVTVDANNGKQAILNYQLKETAANGALSRLRCTLFTGRKHQIRVQLTAIGHPICGDPVYSIAPRQPQPDTPSRDASSFPPPPHQRLALHAASLTFEHPHSRKRVTFESPMPGVMVHLLKQGKGRSEMVSVEKTGAAVTPDEPRASPSPPPRSGPPRRRP